MRNTFFISFYKFYMPSKKSGGKYLSWTGYQVKLYRCIVLTFTISDRLETPLILTINAPKANSAVQQLFNSGRPPPPAIEPQLVTSETLRYERFIYFASFSTLCFGRYFYFVIFCFAAVVVVCCLCSLSSFINVISLCSFFSFTQGMGCGCQTQD